MGTWSDGDGRVDIDRRGGTREQSRPDNHQQDKKCGLPYLGREETERGTEQRWSWRQKRRRAKRGSSRGMGVHVCFQCLPSPESQKLSDENADAGMTTMFGLAARQITRRTLRQKTSRHEQGKGKWLALKPGGPKPLDQSQDKRPFRSSFRSRLLVG